MRQPAPQTGFQSPFQRLLGRRYISTVFPATAAMEARPDVEEDPEGRGDWFLFQRTYPSVSIPPDARLKAWKSRTEFRLNSTVVGQATQTWRPIGPTATVSVWYPWWGLTSGRVNSIAVAPKNPRVVLAGSSSGGIWRSTDGGESFVPVSDEHVDLAVGSITFSKSNPSIVYAGMGDFRQGYLGSGVLKSTDEGATWVRISNNSLPSPGTISKLEIDPADPDRVYVAQYSRVSGDKVTSSGIYLSTDGGVKWTRTFAGAPRDLVIHPGDWRTLYAGLSRIDKDVDPPLGLYRSTDAGSSWSMVFEAPPYELNKRRDFRVAVSPANPQKLYTYFGGSSAASSEAHLRSSTDGGASWTEHSLATVDTAQLGYNTYLFADARDAQIVYLGSRDLFRSTDGGESWTNLTRNFYDSGQGFTYAPGGSATHTDQHALAFSPASPNEYYLGNDGGVSKTTDGGSTFNSLNATLNLTQFIGIAVHPVNPAMSYGGSQDNGTQQRLAGSMSWQEVLLGDGGHIVINPLDPSMVFMTYIRGDIYRYVNDGQTMELQIGYNEIFGENFDPPRIAFYPPFVGNGVDATLYFGTWRLFISNNLGNSWVAPSGFLDLTKGTTGSGRDVLSSIAVARANTDVIYTGSSQGRAMVSTNGGRSWTDITDGLPNRSITSITVDPSNSAVAYLTVSGFGSGHVFRTADAGATWKDISNDLPNIPANVLLVDRNNSETLYLGTDIGVFRSTSRGASWKAFNRGLPPVIVHDLVQHPTGLIQVATYGRGAYELKENEPPVITSVSFDGKKQLTIKGAAFGESPTVRINGEDRSSKIASNSDASILLFGKIKKLGIRSGENIVQVVTDGLSSNVFTISLTL